MHYCANETIHGLELPSTPTLKREAPERLVIADMASNIGTRRIDWNNIDLGYGQYREKASTTTITNQRGILAVP